MIARVHGSKNGSIIKARFNGKSKSFFPTLKNTKALVLLSIIGNEFCSGDYLKSIIDTALSTHGFTTFLIADEVYWHNLRYSFSDEEELLAKKQAMSLGANYLEINLKYFLSALDIELDAFNHEHSSKSIYEKISVINNIAKKSLHFEILSWNDWLNKCPSFLKDKQEIYAFYHTESSLKNSIDHTASNFSKRHQNNELDFDLLYKRSEHYLLDESTAVILIAAKLEYNFIIYPGEIIKPFKTTKEFFIKGEDENVGNSLYIKYKDPKLLVNWLSVSFQKSHDNPQHHQKNIHIQDDDSNIDNTVLHLSKSETSAIIKGVTEGIFSLEIQRKEKIMLLIDFLLEYQRHHKIN